MQFRAPRYLLACFVLAASLTVAGAQQSSRPGTMAADARSGSIEAGRAIVVGAFGNSQPSQAQQGACFQCHGMDGKGDGAAAFPRLTDQVYTYLYESLKDYASGARNNRVMGPIAAALTEQQMRDVSAYYAAQKGAPYDARPEVNPDQLQYGASLAAIGSATRGVQGCINCHGPDGAGLQPTPYLAGQYANYLEAQLKAWKTGARRGGAGGGVMEQIAKRLTDEDIRAVSLYYASIRPSSVTPEQQATALSGGNANQPAR